MPSLKAIRRRIQTVRNTQQITKAMKMVSGAKFRRAEERLRLYREGFSFLPALLNDLIRRNDLTLEQNPFFRFPAEGKELFVLVSSDRGLCGPFNHNLFKKFQELCEAEGIRRDDLLAVAVGKKAGEYARRFRLPLLRSFSPVPEPPPPLFVAQILDVVVPPFLSGEVRRVRVVANHFINALKQVVEVRTLLPLSPPSPSSSSGMPFLTEPSPEELLKELIEEYLQGVMTMILLDSFAGEHGARMSAMDSATNNAQEMIRVLTLTYNRARQASITAELLDIINGKNAIES
jgi:F-type H+-transporting ATPase subunit gamma